MIKDPHIRHLLKKHALNTCTREEKEILINFFKNNDTLDIGSIPSVEEINEFLEEDPHKIDEEPSLRIYEKIIGYDKNIKREKTLKKSNSSVKRFLKVAAVFTGLMVLGVLYKNNYLSNKSSFDQEDVQQTNITLQLDNGEIKVIDTEGVQDLTDVKGSVVGKQVKNSITYSKDTEVETLSYNTLNIPYGQTFELLLSDGTVAHLNAGTSIKYPVKFLEGHSREVFLEGEAYFDVAKDKEHLFVVNNKGVNVEVYGTKFNVSTYPEDENTDVVLVEGSVSMYKTDSISNPQESTKVMLVPGVKGSFNKTNETIETKQVVTSIYTSWVHGELVFRDMTFANILKKMERRYNVSITINNDALAQEIFNASFRNEPLEKVLEYLKLTYDINYTIKDNHITIQ
ncbi:FecR family protein [Snuella sedimenti]|uniref:FecR family protein n=1 Tax=Snuella sedimenti TaxID=2798802 RepID=A0A8J7LXF8_9FLAO|nr:FecR family protein [Snuella sedimenti]MBJ6366671.1 FecR family protein [Snuella sedimenti]